MIRFFATAAALWFAATVIPGITHSGSVLSLLGVAVVFGVVNTLVAPIVKLFSLPFIVLSFGLFLLIINAAMLMLTSWIAGKLELHFHVNGFIAAFVGSFVISVVSAILTYVFDDRRRRDGEQER